MRTKRKEEKKRNYMENNILVKGKYDENECETQNLWKFRKSKKNYKKECACIKERNIVD